jgi:hypothetical protein
LGARFLSAGAHNVGMSKNTVISIGRWSVAQ